MFGGLNSVHLNPNYFLTKDLRGKDHSEDLGVDGKVILEWIIGKLSGMRWTACIYFRIRTSGGIL
jgi:hypothetical protein